MLINSLTNSVTDTLIHKLRNKNTDSLVFKHTIKELTKQLIYEALKDFPTQATTTDTWRGIDTFNSINQSEIVVTTVLRAGMPMLESVMETLPDISAGFLAIKRDEQTHKSKLYYNRLPECKNKTIILVDPMLATGGSLCDAIEVIKQKEPKEIVILNILASPEGLDKLDTIYKDITLYVAKIDKNLDENMFLFPGIGDAGDRAYNTEVE